MDLHNSESASKNLAACLHMMPQLTELTMKEDELLYRFGIPVCLHDSFYLSWKMITSSLEVKVNFTVFTCSYNIVISKPNTDIYTCIWNVDC